MHFDKIDPEEKNKILNLIPKSNREIDDFSLNTIVPKGDLDIIQYEWISIYKEITMRIAHAESFSNERFVIKFVPDVLGNEYQYLLLLKAEISKVEQKNYNIPHENIEPVEECGQSNTAIYLAIAIVIIIAEAIAIIGLLIL